MTTISIFFNQSLAIFIAEIRSASRSKWLWCFAAATASGVGWFYFHYSYLHGFLSGQHWLAGHLGPRFMLPQIGPLLLWLALPGTVFLAVDVRARDSRDRLSDVLDAKPLSNMALEPYCRCRAMAKRFPSSHRSSPICRRSRNAGRCSHSQSRQCWLPQVTIRVVTRPVFRGSPLVRPYSLWSGSSPSFHLR